MKRRWTGSVLAIRGRLYIQVKDPSGRWRQRATGLTAHRENWERAEQLLAEVRGAMGRPLPPPSAALPSRAGSRAKRRERKARSRRGLGRAACENCSWSPPAGMDSILNVHHVRPRAAAGTDHTDNLLVLCPNCHAIAHALCRRRRLWTRDALLPELQRLASTVLKPVGAELAPAGAEKR